VLTQHLPIPGCFVRLHAHREEVEALFHQVLINVTTFYRDPEVFEFAGCSSGQEVYPTAKAFLKFSTSGDIDQAMLERARAGRFTRSLAPALSPVRLRRFLIEGEGFHVGKPIRELCVFARHDVANDLPFSRMDRVSCRNLLTYFEAALQKKHPSFPLRAQGS
jgi:two-component system, chemotaxis family, CheB/CheR fusion protein